MEHVAADVQHISKLTQVCTDQHPRLTLMFLLIQAGSSTCSPAATQGAACFSVNLCAAGLIVFNYSRKQAHLLALSGGRKTSPTAEYGNCVVSLTRTLTSVLGQPSHASVGCSLAAVAVCRSDRFLFEGLSFCAAGIACLLLAWAAPGNTSLQQ